MSLLWVTAMAMREPRYTHSTDALLKPGDIIRPAAERGRDSKWKDIPGYDPHRVYLHDTQHPDYSDDHGGAHTYGVEPLGEVGPDPEVEHWKQHYRNHPEEAADHFGSSPDEPWHESDLGNALSSVTAPAARVTHHLCCQGKTAGLSPEDEALLLGHKPAPRETFQEHINRNWQDIERQSPEYQAVHCPDCGHEAEYESYHSGQHHYECPECEHNFAPDED